METQLTDLIEIAEPRALQVNNYRSTWCSTKTINMRNIIYRYIFFYFCGQALFSNSIPTITFLINILRFVINRLK